MATQTTQTHRATRAAVSIQPEMEPSFEGMLRSENRDRDSVKSKARFLYAYPPMFG